VNASNSRFIPGRLKWRKTIMSTHVWPRRLLTALYWYVALTFFMGFVTKF